MFNDYDRVIINCSSLIQIAGLQCSVAVHIDASVAFVLIAIGMICANCSLGVYVTSLCDNIVYKQ